MKILQADDILDVFKAIPEAVEEQRQFLLNKFGEYALRPFFLHLYESLSEDCVKVSFFTHSIVKNKIFQARQLKQTKKFEMSALLEDIIMFVLYIILLYLAIYANKNPLTVENNLQINRLISGIFTNRSLNIEELDYIEKLVHLN